MFVRLERKITMYMVLTIFLFVLTIGSIAFLLVSRNYINTYTDSATKTVRLAINYSKIKLDNIVTDGEKITSDEVVIEGLQVPDYVISINPKLNFLRSLYQEEIIGLTIYGSNGRLYKTDSLSTGSIIPYDTLTQNSDFSEFIASDATNGLILLPQGQAIYAFSLIFRISDDTSDLGYLLININPDYLLDEYFALSDNADLILNHNLIMVDSQVYYPSISKIDTDLALESQASGFSDGYRNYVIKENLYIEDVELITSVNSSGLRTDIGKLAWQIALIIISFTVASFFLSTLISKSVSSRLKHLAKRMESATDTMQKQSPVD